MKRAFWEKLCLVISVSFMSQGLELGNVDKNRNFAFANLQSGLYILGEIPINGLVKSFCAFGAIQTNEMDDINENETRGRVTFYISGNRMTLGPYAVEQPWNSSEIACVCPSPAPVVMQSKRIYVFLRRRCNNESVCPLQVNYKSDEKILHASIPARRIVEAIIRNNVEFTSISMTSLNVQVSIQAVSNSTTPGSNTTSECAPVTSPGFSTTTPTELAMSTVSNSMSSSTTSVVVPVSVVVVVILVMIVLLLGIAHAYRTIQKKKVKQLQRKFGEECQPLYQLYEKDFNIGIMQKKAFKQGSPKSSQLCYNNRSKRCLLVMSNADVRESHTMNGHFSATSLSSLAYMYHVAPEQDDTASTPGSAATTSDDGSALFKLSKFDAYVNKAWIPFHQLKIKEEIGKGAFGYVLKGTLTQNQDLDIKEIKVAVKTIKNSTGSYAELKEFIDECQLMCSFNHPHVLGLIGISLDTNNSPYLLLPYMENGDLKNFLKQKRTDGLSQDILLRMCREIAEGMEYLASKKLVHRDLAARNCMVDETWNVKVGDFGLTRDIYETDYYRLNHTTRMPIKWMAPESMSDRISNEKTDVWSYGVTCWEVYSMGKTPYPTISNIDILQHLEQGHRLKQPVLCPDSVFSLMKKCWEEDPGQRPNFSEIDEILASISALQCQTQPMECTCVTTPD